MHSKYVLADPNSPIAVCEKKVWFARVSLRGFPQLFSTCSCFLFGLFCFLVSCNLEVLNCGGVAFDLS